MWITNSRGMMSWPGNSPPKTRDAIHGPTTGIESKIE